MASPFHVFRKNQKAMIATLGLLAIGAFVFLTPFAMYSGGGGGRGPQGDNPVVVTTEKYGNLTERDIDIMQSHRQRLWGFFDRLVSESNKDNYMAMLQGQAQVRQHFGNISEEAVVNTWLLAQQAKQEGMSVSDMDVEDLISVLTNNKATADIIVSTLAQSDLNEDMLFDLLQQEILAKNLQDSFLISVVPSTPGQRWDYFQRLNRKVNAQVSPVEVERFVVEVPEPTEEELKAFFEEHKNRIPMQGSAMPGFRLPQMVDVEYIKADYDKFAASDAVTDAEIEQYYNENRDRYRIIDLPGLPADMGLETPATLRGLKDGINSETPAGEKSIEPPVEPKEAISPVKKSPKKKAPKKESPKKDAAEKPSEAEKTESKTSGVTRSVFRLVSMEEEKKADPAPEKSTDAKPADVKPADAKPAAAEAKSTEVEPAAEAPKKSKPNLDPSKLGAGLGDLSTPISGPPTLSGKAYKPLEEVKEDIRSALALQKARERMEKALNKAKKKIKNYSDKLAVSSEGLTDEQVRERLSKFIRELAEKENFVYVKTGLLSATDLRETEVGKSTIQDAYQPVSVADVIVDRMNDQQFRVALDLDQNHYLFWRLEKVEEKTPELEDKGVREKVVQAWKQFKARDLAVKEAERLAKVARESGQSLQNSIEKSEGVPVKSTGQFSWFQRQFAPGIGQTLAMGRPQNVEMAGPDFMEAVYDLEPKGITVAMNHPETVAYVVQLTDTSPSEKVLWTIFKSDNFANYQDIVRGDLIRAMGKWIEGLKKDAGLVWERSAVQPRPQRQR